MFGKLFHEKERMKAYLSVVRNDQTESLFLTEKKQKTNIITINGKVFHSRRQLPKLILDDMIANKKAEIISGERISICGKKNIFGIPLTRSETLNVGGIRYIQIRVLADTLDDLVNKMSLIKIEMSKHGIIPKTCYWNQVGDLNLKEEEEDWIPTVQSEFNQEELIAQKQMELDAYRED